MNSNTQERNFLLIIGIDKYTHLEKLNNAVKDAKDIQSLMVSNFQFREEHCIALLNEEATNDNIISKLDHLVDDLTEEDSLLIYYAGHGEFKQKIDTGYWIPVDAKSDTGSDYIPHAMIIRHLKSIKAKHIVLLSDSCFSGSIFDERYRSPHTKRVSKMPSRWCLTSGRKEKVSDGTVGKNSPFAEAIITYLTKGKSKEVLIQDLNRHVEKDVANSCNQTPMCGRLSNIGDKGGEFVFYRKTKSKKNQSKDVNASIEYLPPTKLLSKIDEHFFSNFSKVFQISDANNYQEKKEKIREIIDVWTQNISIYCHEFESAFSEKKLRIYDNPSYYQDFKSKVFAKKLWTVSAALNSPESDLVRYKKAFVEVQPKKLFESFKRIITKAEHYVQRTGNEIDFNNLSSVEDLKQNFFEEEGMLLKSIIGRGIRSEILHKKYPSIFPLMTRKSQWGMFFLSGESTEFIMYEKGTGKNKGKTRFTNQYNYNYPRFNYYNNEIIKRLTNYLAEYDLYIDNSIRFGYPNEFLREIDSHNNEKRQDLNTWK